MVCIPLCASILFVLPAGNHPNAISACVSYAPIRNHNSKCAPPAGHHRVALSFSAPVNNNHCAFHPSAMTIAISACAFQSVHSTHRQSTVTISACPTSASTTTVHCAFHLPQSELVLSISTPVNENRFCSPHNRQPDRNQCLWIPWCAFHYVLPFCSFCLLATTPMQSVPVCPTLASEITIQSMLHLLAITELCFLFLHQ